eukprot:m.355680 g.355680  ORF g.355680 m.355680 type:complete len:79 (-) comp17305_c0_seq1:182-418(-)
MQDHQLGGERACQSSTCRLLQLRCLCSLPTLRDDPRSGSLHAWLPFLLVLRIEININKTKFGSREEQFHKVFLQFAVG